MCCLQVLSEPALIIVDDVTVDCLPHLKPFCECSDVKMILLTYSPTDEMSLHIDSVLHRGTSQIISVSPLTNLQVTQRLVYTLVRQFNLTPNKSDQRIISDLSSLCCGFPVILRLMESLVTHYMTRESDGLTMCFNLIEEKMDGGLISQVDVDEIQDNIDNLNIRPSLVISSILGCLMDIGKISTASRTLLNCLSTIRGIPIPLEVITCIKQEIESSCTMTTSIIEELQRCNCLCTYPSPVIKSCNDPLINSKLFIVPDIIGDAVLNHLTSHEDHIMAIGMRNKVLSDGSQVRRFFLGQVFLLKESCSCRLEESVSVKVCYCFQNIGKMWSCSSSKEKNESYQTRPIDESLLFSGKHLNCYPPFILLIAKLNPMLLSSHYNV